MKLKENEIRVGGLGCALKLEWFTYIIKIKCKVKYV